MDRKELIIAVQEELSKPNSDDRLQRLQDPNQQKIELEMKKRFINAKQLSRVTPEKNPDFIGNFNKDYPSGIFEMFIEEKNGDDFKGTAEDCLGTATVKGTLSNTEISFIKHYIPEKSSVDASKCDIEYKGIFLEDEYDGEYTFTDDRRFGGKFFLKKDFLSQI